MKETFLLYILLIFIILLLVMAAGKLRIAAPLLLVPGGLLLSSIPHLSHISIDPELIFIIFLPPLLYDAAWQTSWKEMWRWRRVISVFAILIVVLTSGVVAFVAHAWIPGFTLALGFLLGGIVSPPDAISATSVMRLVKVPKRLNHILEGESLLNDASSLIIFKFALAAIDTGRFVAQEAIGSFFLVIIMGIATGVLIALGYYAIHRWLPTNPDIDIVLTLTAPYVMYIAAESLHFSGVLAVVSGSLFQSTRKTSCSSAPAAASKAATSGRPSASSSTASSLFSSASNCPRSSGSWEASVSCRPSAMAPALQESSSWPASFAPSAPRSSPCSSADGSLPPTTDPAGSCRSSSAGRGCGA
jgi:NhaP-type Na+/H+ or K+/H+ antiporter